MVELDVLATRYYERRFPTAPAAERAAFIRLLESVEDPEIWAWILSQAPPPAEFTHVIQQLQRHT
ncbi:MAG: succinate dehydrogenase assembly factor 2 [Nevskiales bacterium]|nr:succinate dehydrogenase assembly factor 2 [Nevskiales bacterium]